MPTVLFQVCYKKRHCFLDQVLDIETWELQPNFEANRGHTWQQVFSQVAWGVGDADILWIFNFELYKVGQFGAQSSYIQSSYTILDTLWHPELMITSASPLPVFVILLPSSMQGFLGIHVIAWLKHNKHFAEAARQISTQLQLEQLEWMPCFMHGSAIHIGISGGRERGYKDWKWRC